MFFGFGIADLLVLIFVVSYVILSHKRGFFANLFEFTGFCLAFFWAAVFFPFLSFLLQKLLLPESLANTLSFLAIWIVTELFVIRLYQDLFREIPMSVLLSKLNRNFGWLTATLSALAIVTFVATLLIVLPTNSQIKAQVTQSQTLGKITIFTSSFNQPLEKAFAKSVRDSLILLTAEKGQRNDFIKLSFPSLTVKVDEKAETEMLELVNQARTDNNLDPLESDNDLLTTARDHSQDMFERGYFGHYDPDGHDPLYRISKTSLGFDKLGENISYAPDVQTSFEGLMDSEEHKAAILSAEFTKVGIGIVDSKNYGKMVTQLFSD